MSSFSVDGGRVRLIAFCWVLCAMGCGVASSGSSGSVDESQAGLTGVEELERLGGLTMKLVATHLPVADRPFASPMEMLAVNLLRRAVGLDDVQPDDSMARGVAIAELIAALAGALDVASAADGRLDRHSDLVVEWRRVLDGLGGLVDYVLIGRGGQRALLALALGAEHRGELPSAKMVFPDYVQEWVASLNTTALKDGGLGAARLAAVARLQAMRAGLAADAAGVGPLTEHLQGLIAGLPRFGLEAETSYAPPAEDGQ